MAAAWRDALRESLHRIAPLSSFSPPRRRHLLSASAGPHSCRQTPLAIAYRPSSRPGHSGWLGLARFETLPQAAQRLAEIQELTRSVKGGVDRKADVSWREIIFFRDQG